MGKQFEVGHAYCSTDGDLIPITVIKRTEKSIRVMVGPHKWLMRIHVDEDGNEFVTDSAVGQKWRDSFTYRAIWEFE